GAHGQSVLDSSGDRESHRCLGATRHAVGPGSFRTVARAVTFGGGTLGATQTLGIKPAVLSGFEIEAGCAGGPVHSLVGRGWCRAKSGNFRRRNWPWCQFE